MKSNILFIDDEKDHEDFFEAIRSRTSVDKIKHVYSNQSALNEVENFPHIYDLIILDGNILNYDEDQSEPSSSHSFDFFERLKLIYEGKNLARPTVLLRSAHIGLLNKEFYIRSIGEENFFQKGHKRQALIDRIEEELLNAPYKKLKYEYQEFFETLKNSKLDQNDKFDKEQKFFKLLSERVSYDDELLNDLRKLYESFLINLIEQNRIPEEFLNNGKLNLSTTRFFLSNNPAFIRINNEKSYYQLKEHAKLPTQLRRIVDYLHFALNEESHYDETKYFSKRGNQTNLYFKSLICALIEFFIYMFKFYVNDVEEFQWEKT